MGKVVKGVTDVFTGGSAKDQARGAATESIKAGRQAAKDIRAQPFQVDLNIEKRDTFNERTLAGNRRAAAITESKDLREQLRRQASGEGPSLATAQLKQAQDRTLAQQLAAAGAARGGNAAALQRQLARQQGTAGQELAQQAAVTRMQEQQGAQQQLGAMLSQEQAASDQAVNNYLRLGFDLRQAEIAAQQDLERLRQAARAGAGAQAANAFAQAKAGERNMTGGLIGGAAQLIAASDKNLKKNIKDAKGETKKFLEALSAKKYEYKPESGEASGDNYGIIAQDLEKSKMGKSLVMDTPKGKMVDTRRGFGAALAAMADLNKRTAELERAMKKRKMKKKKES